MRKVLAAALAAFILGSTGCKPPRTDELAAPLEQRFQYEGILRRARDLDFHYTRDPGGYDERREDRRASIIVTKATVYVHKNEKAGFEITPRTRRRAAVQRSGERVRVRIGSGRSEEIWSFIPPDDPAGWTSDIRAVIAQASRR